MKPLRRVLGGFAGLTIVLCLTLAMVASTLLLGFLPTAVGGDTETREQVSPAAPTEAEAVLAANR